MRGDRPHREGRGPIVRHASPVAPVARLAAAATTVLLVAACTRVLPPDAHPGLGVGNGTTMTVTLVVNGQRIADYPPGQYPPSQPSSSVPPGPPIDPMALPALPWAVEVRSPSGRVLDSFHVDPGDVKAGAETGGFKVGAETTAQLVWILGPRLPEPSRPDHTQLSGRARPG